MYYLTTYFHPLLPALTWKQPRFFDVADEMSSRLLRSLESEEESSIQSVAALPLLLEQEVRPLEWDEEHVPA